MNTDTSTPLLPFEEGMRIKTTAPPRKPNIPHSEATAESRSLSFDDMKGKRSKRHRLILECLAKHGAQTAREVLRRLVEQGDLPSSAERNATSPRLSELAEVGCVETLEELRIVGNDAPASVWQITEKGKLFLQLQQQKN